MDQTEEQMVEEMGVAREDQTVATEGASREEKGVALVVAEGAIWVSARAAVTRAAAMVAVGEVATEVRVEAAMAVEARVVAVRVGVVAVKVGVVWVEVVKLEAARGESWVDWMEDAVAAMHTRHSAAHATCAATRR